MMWLKLLGIMKGVTGKQWLVILAAAILAGLAWYGRHEHAGKLAAQTELIQYKAAQAQAVADAVAANEAKHKQTEERNNAIISGLQGTLRDSDARGADLARRLRNALAALRPSPVPPSADQPTTPVAPGVPAGADEAGQLVGAIAVYDAACVRDAARFNALIEQIKPQL